MQKKSIFHRSGILLAVLAPTLCTGLLHAAGLSLSATTATTITCNTATTGPANPVTITVKPGTDITYPVVRTTLGALPAGLVVPHDDTASAIAANVTSGQAFVLSAAPGCAAGCRGREQRVHVPFRGGTKRRRANGFADPNNVTTTITANIAVSGLSATASASTVTCSLSGGVYTPTPSTVVLTVNNTATGGTPFMLTKPTWLTLAKLTHLIPLPRAPRRARSVSHRSVAVPWELFCPVRLH